MSNWTLQHRVVADGVEVAYDILGSGPPVVLVHGFPSHSFIWRKVAPELAKTQTVYLYDLPGQGLSEKRDGLDVSDPRQARVLKELLAFWRLECPAIVLHDIGNSYGMIAHYDEGCRFERIAFVSAAVLNPCVTEATLHAQKYIEAYRTMPTWIYEQILEARIRSTTFNPISDEALQTYRTPFSGEAGQAIWYNRVAQIDPRHTSRLESQLGPLGVPARIIWGADDTWIPLDQAKRLQDLLGGPQLNVVKAGGHFLMEDAPEEVTRHLIDFLKEDAMSSAVRGRLS